MLPGSIKIFTDSLSLYHKNWRALFPYLILLFIPVLVTVSLAVALFYLEVIFKIPAIKFFGDILMVIILLAGVLFSFWTIVALTINLKNAIENQPVVSWKAGLKSSYRLLLPAVLATVLAALIIFGSTLLLIIPGVITFIWYLFTLYTVLFEDANATTALKKSKMLVIGRWWHIAWRWFVPFILFVISIAIANLIINFVLSAIFDGLFWHAVASRLTGSAIWIAISPAVLSAPLILYLEAKKTARN